MCNSFRNRISIPNYWIPHTPPSNRVVSCGKLPFNPFLPLCRDNSISSPHSTHKPLSVRLLDKYVHWHTHAHTHGEACLQHTYANPSLIRSNTNRAPQPPPLSRQKPTAQPARFEALSLHEHTTPICLTRRHVVASASRRRRHTASQARVHTCAAFFRKHCVQSNLSARRARVARQRQIRGTFTDAAAHMKSVLTFGVCVRACVCVSARSRLVGWST